MKISSFIASGLVLMGCIFFLYNSASSDEKVTPNFTGIITQIDLKGKVIEVKRKDTIRSFYFDDEPQVVTLDKEKKSLSDLTIGLKISVIWAPEDGRRLISKIKIR